MNGVARPLSGVDVELDRPGLQYSAEHTHPATEISPGKRAERRGARVGTTETRPQRVQRRGGQNSKDPFREPYLILMRTRPADGSASKATKAKP